MSLKRVLLIILFLLTMVAFGQVSIAGTWIDDFSDRTLWDWGGTEGLEDDELRVGVHHGQFNYRGIRVNAGLQLTNHMLGKVGDFTLEIKFMVRRIQGPAPSSWGIRYYTYDEETGNFEGLLDFKLQHVFDQLKERELTSLRIVVWEVHPDFLTRKFDVQSPFAYEKEVWYTFKIGTDGNRYTFSVDDALLEAEDSSVPAGWIELRVSGRCDIRLDDFTVTGANVPDGGPGRWRAVLPVEKLTTSWGKLKAPN